MNRPYRKSLRGNFGPGPPFWHRPALRGDVLDSLASSFEPPWLPRAPFLDFRAPFFDPPGSLLVCFMFLFGFLVYLMCYF